MNTDAYLRKLRFRASHRGTREADAMVGGFFEKYHALWTAEDFAWFEILIEEQDVDIMSWAFKTSNPPESLSGPMMDRLRTLDFIHLPAGLSKDT
jgi:antitoxin CptB